MCGCCREDLQSSMDEFMWRHNRCAYYFFKYSVTFTLTNLNDILLFFVVYKNARYYIPASSVV